MQTCKWVHPARNQTFQCGCTTLSSSVTQQPDRDHAWQDEKVYSSGQMQQAWESYLDVSSTACQSQIIFLHFWDLKTGCLSCFYTHQCTNPARVWLSNWSLPRVEPEDLDWDPEIHPECMWAHSIYNWKQDGWRGSKAPQGTAICTIIII